MAVAARERVKFEDEDEDEDEEEDDSDSPDEEHVKLKKLDEAIGEVLEGQTRFWVGPAFGLGFYRAGAFSVAFTFDAMKSGINDSLEETYEFTLGEVTGPGPHVVVVRASDLLGNVATGRVEIP